MGGLGNRMNSLDTNDIQSRFELKDIKKGAGEFKTLIHVVYFRVCSGTSFRLIETFLARG